MISRWCIGCFSLVDNAVRWSCFSLDDNTVRWSLNDKLIILCHDVHKYVRSVTSLIKERHHIDITECETNLSNNHIHLREWLHSVCPSGLSAATNSFNDWTKSTLPDFHTRISHAPLDEDTSLDSEQDGRFLGAGRVGSESGCLRYHPEAG